MSAAEETEPTTWTTSKRAAELLGVSIDTIRRWLDKGYMPNAYQPAGGGHWRIPRADIAALKERWSAKRS